MQKFYSTFALFFIVLNSAFAQNETVAFGKVNPSDFELKECPFEKDANAMVLFDKGEVIFSSRFEIIMSRHKRIKIFSEKGKQAANIRLEYSSGGQFELLNKLQAQTINLVNGKPEIIKVDKKSIYTEAIDKNRTAVIFSFANVQEGSILEFKYEWSTKNWSNFPSWFFQDNLPVGYSELKTAIPDMLQYQVQSRTRQSFIKNKVTSESKTLGAGENALPYADIITTRALSNISTLHDEPFMSSRRDNLQCLIFELSGIKPIYGFADTFVDSWAKVGGYIAEDEDFGGQLKRKLAGEEVIVTNAAALKSDADKIAYIFNEVRNTMKWNSIDRWYTNDGTVKAWEKKTGNSTEINLILYHFLKKAGVDVFPMIVSTREHGKVRRENPSMSPFNRAVVFIPGSEKTRGYVLDASDKFQSYNTIPFQLLNSNGLYIDKENKRFNIIFINTEEPVKSNISLTAEIKPDGKMKGEAVLTDYSYFKEKSLKDYKNEGESKYKELLKNKTNNLTINNLQLKNVEIDSLPLVQALNFEAELPEADNNYLYFSPTILSPLKENAFLAENRATDIDFGCKNSYSISGTFIIPQGFKVESLPKTITMVTPDKGVSFKRLAAEEDGIVQVRYNIDFHNTHYFKENYPDFREFYKEMNEMLNEQIVLKKL